MTATAHASAELRAALRHPYYVPLPLNDSEQADFTLFLTFNGVALTPCKKHLGSFTADHDLCSYAWKWREQRGEIVPKGEQS